MIAKNPNALSDGTQFHQYLRALQHCGDIFGPDPTFFLKLLKTIVRHIVRFRQGVLFFRMLSFADSPAYYRVAGRELFFGGFHNGIFFGHYFEQRRCFGFVLTLFWGLHLLLVRSLERDRRHDILHWIVTGFSIEAQQTRRRIWVVHQIFVGLDSHILKLQGSLGCFFVNMMDGDSTSLYFDILHILSKAFFFRATNRVNMPTFTYMNRCIGISRYETIRGKVFKLNSVYSYFYVLPHRVGTVSNIWSVHSFFSFFLKRRLFFLVLFHWSYFLAHWE